ncbi:MULTISPECIES: flavodoxin domain-containing protein [unclassified Streptomyces]|uniref:flavodoxin domain-containing protein n=1 Tax=unclassified Streptomyces TaxID=2593676 RepID=UPI00036AA54F|nr:MULTISPECIES: flavodoxin domain-containing protein [unclassified Streptomyces]
MSVLISYAGEHGSTQEVAERIAARLALRDHPIEVLPAGPSPSEQGWTAVVIGSAVHNGAWLPAAAECARRHHDGRPDMPIWMFSVGMLDALRGPLRRLAERGEQQPIARLVESIGPRGYRRFSGVILPEHLGRLGRLLFRAGGGHFGDYRDWRAIDAWADDIADTLIPGHPRHRSPGDASG